MDGAAADLSWLKTNVSFDEILKTRDAVITDPAGGNVSALRKMTRLLEDGSRLVYITNITGDVQENLQICFPGAETIAEIRIADVTVHSVYGEKTADGICAYTHFEDSESHLYLVNGTAEALLPGKPVRPASFIAVPERVAFAEKPENMMLLDMVSIAKGDGAFEEPLSLYGVKDNLLKEQYEGEIHLKYTFTAADTYKTDKLNLVLEPMGQHTVCVNGTKVEEIPGAYWFDRSFKVYPISELVKPGTNEVIVSLHYYQRPYVYYVLYSGVSESLRNCLVFDTEIECAYLTGDFALATDAPFVPADENCYAYNGSFTLCEQKMDVRTDNVVEDGYAFYGGKMHLAIPYTWKPGAPTVLHLDGRFATCKVSVNGIYAGEMLFSRTIDLTEYLKEGENEICLVLCNAMRNLMGPHHRTDPEPYFVCPTTFSYEHEWNGRECQDYTDRYAFTRYGLVK